MKKIVSIVMVSLIVLSTFSMLSPQTKAEPDETPLEVAEKAAVWIMDEAIHEDGSCKWKFYTPRGREYYPSSINTGTAGYGMLFLSLYEETENALYLDYAECAADWLITQAVSSAGGYKWPQPDDDRSNWWLSPTVSGIGEFLLRIYQITGDSTYLDYARGAAQWLSAMAYHGEPGIFVPYNPPNRYGSQAAHGISPGRETEAPTFLLHMYEETGNTDYLTYIEGTAEWLIDGPDKRTESGGYKWRHNRPYGTSYPMEGMSRIALFFYEIYEAFGNAEYLEHANGAMTWLLSQAVVDDDQAKWPSSQGGSQYLKLPFTGSWAGTEPRVCNVLWVAYSVTGNAAYLEYAMKHANWVVKNAVPEGGGYKWPYEEGGSRYNALHNARVYNFLSWMYDETGETSYSEYANGALTWIVYNAEETDGGYKWRTLTYHPYYPTWFGPGAAGIGYYLISAPPTIPSIYVLDLDKLYIELDKNFGHISKLRFKDWGTTDITPVDDLDSTRPFSAVAFPVDNSYLLGGTTPCSFSVLCETPKTVVIECKNDMASIIYHFYKHEPFFDMEIEGHEIWQWVQRYSFVPEEYATQGEIGTWSEKQVIVKDPWIAIKYSNIVVATSWDRTINKADHVTLDNTEGVPVPPGATAKGVDIGDLWTIGSLIPEDIAIVFRWGVYFAGDPWYQPGKDQFEQLQGRSFRDDFSTFTSDLWRIKCGDRGPGPTVFKPEHANVDGVLTLTTPAGTREGGEIDSHQLYWYGRYRAKIKAESVRHTVKGFFLYKSPDGEQEIDIEFGIDPTNPKIINLGTYAHDNHYSALYLADFDPSKDFHIYGFDWYPDRVEFFVDEDCVDTVTGIFVPDEPAFLMFNSWVPKWQDGSLPHQTTSIYVDWVQHMSFIALIKDYFPYWHFSGGEQWYPTSFYFDDDIDVENNPENYDNHVGSWNKHSVYIHTVVDDKYLTLQYWLYYSWNHHWLWPDHDHDWDSTIFIQFDKSDMTQPARVGFSHHWSISYSDWTDENLDKIGNSVVTYVAEGSHGAYTDPDDVSGFPYFDDWSAGGIMIGPEDVDNQVMARKCAKELELTISGDKRWFCSLYYHDLKGEHPTPSQAMHNSDVYWPRDFPGSGVAPWHRSQWTETTPHGIFSLAVGAESPVDILVTDQDGARIGHDPSIGTIMEIEGAIYCGPASEPEVILIPNPLTGTYRVEVFGTDSGPYAVTIATQCPSGSIKDSQTYSGETVEGAVYVYTVLITDEVMSTNPDPVAELEHLKDFIDELPDDSFNKPRLASQRKNALFNKIAEVILKVEAGNYTDAINKLFHDIRAKMDGDSTAQDWIIDPETQIKLCVIIDHIISSIETLQQD